jgi:type II secretory pathway pseudopilin PulG
VKLLIIIAIVMVLAIVVLATSGAGPRVTTITRRKVRDEEGEDRDA